VTRIIRAANGYVSHLRKTNSTTHKAIKSAKRTPQKMQCQEVHECKKRQCHRSTNTETISELVNQLGKLYSSENSEVKDLHNSSYGGTQWLPAKNRTTFSGENLNIEHGILSFVFVISKRSKSNISQSFFHCTYQISYFILNHQILKPSCTLQKIYLNRCNTFVLNFGHLINIL